MNMPDINEMELLKEVVEVDGNVDSAEFFNPPLPDDGEYEAIIGLGQDGFKVNRQKKDKGSKERTGPAYLMVHLQFKLLDPKTGQPLGPSTFDRPTSIVMQSGTSSLHAILDLAGARAPDRCDLNTLKQHIEIALAQNLHIGVVTAWEAQINRGTKDAPDYDTLAKGQRRFRPVKDDAGNDIPGKHDPEFIDPRTQEIVRAQARNVKYKRVSEIRQAQTAGAGR